MTAVSFSLLPSFKCRHYSGTTAVSTLPFFMQLCLCANILKFLKLTCFENSSTSSSAVDGAISCGFVRTDSDDLSLGHILVFNEAILCKKHYENRLVFKSMAVVYFNQRLAAVHSNAGQNMSISLFPQTIRKKWQNEAK